MSNEAALVRQIAAWLRLQGSTLAVAESCTGGRLADRITSLAGSSIFFRGGIVAYADEVKVALLGVKRQSLACFGAVSGAVAVEMARGVRQALAADYGVGVTGVAGPGGGTAKKPVGTVFVAVIGPGTVKKQRFLFKGTRSSIKRQSCIAALEMLRASVQKARIKP
ncbi:MAG: CinA family protein [Kiritimatiellia bacterium]